ncbi:MAG: purine-binding chemotaxis protein CheW [Proteobacteria bacterium]|nr:purine-binding chemotaxis protein CheW [Pseudomonadota bacterium]
MAKKKKNLDRENCWQRIGVWGTETPRCPELETVIHCRNCDVFHAASLEVYEQRVPEDYRREWTSVLSGDKDDALSETRAVIIFRIGDEWVTLAANLCREITKMSKIHRLPHNKNSILKGVVSSAGEVQPCFSLGAILGLSKGERDYDEESHAKFKRLLVLEKEGKRFAFPVTEIIGIYHFKGEEMEALPKTLSDSLASYMRGIIKYDGKSVGCIDEDLLISQIERSLQ